MNDNVRAAKRLLAEALCAIEVAKDVAAAGPVWRKLELASANAEQALMWLDGVQVSAAFDGSGFADGEQGPLPRQQQLDAGQAGEKEKRT